MKYIRTKDKIYVRDYLKVDLGGSLYSSVSFGHAIDFICSKLAELNPVIIQLKSLKDILQRINDTARETDGFAGIARDLNKVEEAIKKSNLEGITEDNIKALENRCYNNELKLESAIPIIERCLEEYHTLEPKAKNDILKEIIE